jgi:hypothetical protein
MADNKKVYSKKNHGNGKKKVQNKNVKRALFTPTDAIGPFYEYTMSKECAADTLRDRRGEDAKKHPAQYLCEFVTEQYGLKGTCVRVNVF